MNRIMPTAVLLTALCAACAGPAPEETTGRPGFSETADEPAPGDGVAEPPEPTAPGASPTKPTARSVLTTLQAVEMSIEAGSAERDLVLHVRFENVSGTGHGLASSPLSGADFELEDADGTTYFPASWSHELDDIVPPAGFAPGSYRDGVLRFPRPRGGEPFELRSPAFEPLRFAVGDLSVPAAVASPVERGRRAGPPPSGDTAQLAEEIDALLDRQARAMERFDMAAYLATFTDTQRDSERKMFLRLRILPLAEVRLEAVSKPTAASGRNPAAPGRLRVGVRLLLRLDGLPADNPFVHSLVYTLAATGDGLRVDAIADEPGQPLAWRRGELTLDRTHHFLIYAPPRLKRDLVHVATEMETAYAELLAQGLPMSSRYVVHLVADRRSYAAIDQGSGSLGVAIGRYWWRDGRLETHSRTFYVNASVYLDESRRHYLRYRQTVVTHELVHLALAGVTSPATPAWLKEGTAVYFSGDISYDATRQLTHGALPRLSLEAMTRTDSLVHAERDRAVDAYLFAGNVVAYLIDEQGGREQFLELYRSFFDKANSLGAAAGPMGALWQLRTAAGPWTDQALGQHYSLSLAELDRAVKDWMLLRHP